MTSGAGMHHTQGSHNRKSINRKRPIVAQLTKATSDL